MIEILTVCVSSQSVSLKQNRWYKRARLRALHRTHSVFPVTFPAYLEEADGFTHGGLDMKRLDILPVLLEERDEEVDA
jgi:hypothetical protein